VTTSPDPTHTSRLLREARRYQALVADAGVMVWAMDPQLRPTGANAAWERYTGQSPEQYRDLGWLDAIQDADRDRCLREIAVNLPRERPFTIEVAIRRSDGAYRRNLIRAIPVRDEHGVLSEWVGTATDVEDHRATADQLGALDERLRLTYEAASVGTWEWFPPRGELRWSDEIFRMLGREPGEIRPSIEAWVAALHPDDRTAATAEWVEMLERADSFSHQFRVVRADGAVRWVLSRARVVRDAEGTIVRVLGLNMDVTDRHAMEQQMAAALAEHHDLRDRLLALTDNAEVLLPVDNVQDARAVMCELAARVLPADGYVVWSFDPDTSIWAADYSVGFDGAFKGERVPGVELPFTEPFVADELEPMLVPARVDWYRAHGVSSLISMPLHVGGMRRAALVAYYGRPHVTTSAERQVAAALGHLAAAALSNAEARARQQLLRREAEFHSRRMAFLAELSTLFSTLDYEASLRRLAELAVPHLGDWCAIDVERDGRISRLTVAHPDPEKLRLAEQLYVPDRLLADDQTAVGRVIRSGQAALYTEITDDVLAAGRDAAELASFRALSMHSAIVAPLTARGRTLGAITLVSSHPDRRYDSGDMQFVELVARRAAMMIDNARLYEEARRANLAKDEFLALLSHELRTPLNAIMGWAQVLLTPTRPGAAEPPVARGLEIIQRNARLQADLVEGLLDVARVSSGGLPLSRQLLDPAEAVASAVEGIRPAAIERGLQLNVATRHGECRVVADANRLHQMLSNLLSNAMKFTERGGRIDVRMGAVNGWCEIEVADTGAGIAPEFLPHVFERFRQADSSATRRHGGLGLGLWLVQELVRAHGGTIRAASDGINRGATFTIQLPVA
jgi:PAS domain S-box-containing protein